MCNCGFSATHFSGISETFLLGFSIKVIAHPTTENLNFAGVPQKTDS